MYLVLDRNNHAPVIVSPVGVDFGASGKLKMADSLNGVYDPPLITGGNGRPRRPTATEAICCALRSGHDIGCESATMGSFGIDQAPIIEAMLDSGRRIYVCSGRMVKNEWRNRHGAVAKDDSGCFLHKKDRVVVSIPDHSDADSAQLILDVLIHQPERFYQWHKNTQRQPIGAKERFIWLRSRGYPQEQMQDWVYFWLPAIEQLTDMERRVLGNSTGRQYSDVRAALLVLAALETNTRGDFDRLCGVFDNGYPSIFRRQLTLEAWQRSGLTWRDARRTLRQLWHRVQTAKQSLHYVSSSEAAA